MRLKAPEPKDIISDSLLNIKGLVWACEQVLEKTTFSSPDDFNKLITFLELIVREANSSIQKVIELDEQTCRLEAAHG